MDECLSDEIQMDECLSDEIQSVCFDENCEVNASDTMNG